MFQHTNSKGPRLKIQPRRIPHLCRYPSIILMTLSNICTYYWGTVQSRNSATIVQNSNAYLIVIVIYLLQNIYVKWCLGIILYCSHKFKFIIFYLLASNLVWIFIDRHCISTSTVPCIVVATSKTISVDRPYKNGSLSNNSTLNLIIIISIKISSPLQELYLQESIHKILGNPRHREY